MIAQPNNGMQPTPKSGAAEAESLGLTAQINDYAIYAFSSWSRCGIESDDAKVFQFDGLRGYPGHH